jgi:hypothetical protein
MPINNIQAVGDDQRWKREVEAELERLKRELAVLKAQFNARNK